MKNTVRAALVCVGAALLLAPGPLSAHHSFVSEFSIAKPVTVKGTLTRLDWVNPHGWIYVDVKDPQGQVEHWKIETGSPLRMEKRGLKKEDFHIGSEVIISGYAARDAKLTAAGMIITFPDREREFPAREASFVLGR